MMGRGHLYRVSDDPRELCDLWNEECFLAVRMELTQALAAQMMKAADPLPVPHNRYRTKVHDKGDWHQMFEAADPGVRIMENIGHHGI